MDILASRGFVGTMAIVLRAIKLSTVKASTKTRSSWHPGASLPWPDEIFAPRNAKPRDHSGEQISDRSE